MINMFKLCVASDKGSGEEDIRLEWADQPPTLDQVVAMGSEQRWVVIKLEPFKGEAGVVTVAYLKRSDRPTLPESEWDCNRFEREYEIGGQGLAVYVYPDRSLSMGYLRKDGQNRVGKILHSYAPTSHPTLMRPVAPTYEIERIDECYQADSYYQSLELCWCKLVPELVAA